MNGAMWAWLRAARLREGISRRRHGPAVSVWEARRQLIERLAPRRSVIDIGGMWSVHGDIAFWAEQAGATNVVLCDGMDPTPEFQRKHCERDSAVRYVQLDLHDTDGIRELGPFDVVWCSGVIYHSPNPYLQLENLRAITAGTLVLGTHVIPEVPGLPQACLWYPDLPTPARDALTRAHGDTSRLLGATTRFDRTEAMGYANFWWGMTPSGLRSMLDIARFHVVAEHRRAWWLLDVVAEPVDRPSVVPEPAFARQRDAARRAGALAGILRPGSPQLR